HATAFTVHDADETRTCASQRHEITKRRHAGFGLEPRLQDEGASSILAADACLGSRRNEPASMLGCPQQRRKAGARIKSRPTQPIDRAVTPDERGRLAIANDGIVLYRQGHDVQSHKSILTFISFLRP